MSSIDDIEKLLTVASKAVGDLHRAIEQHTGADVQKMQMTGNGYVECFVDWHKVTNGFASMEEMMAEIRKVEAAS